MISSVGSVQTIPIKNGDSTSRDAKYLEVQLIDSSLKEGEVSSSLIYFKDFYTTVPITQCYFKVPVTFWNSMAIEVQRYPSGTTINLKGVYVTSHQGRQALKATSLTGVEVNKSYYTISM